LCGGDDLLRDHDVAEANLDRSCRLAHASFLIG
jgi:hypothetical protein